MGKDKGAEAPPQLRSAEKGERQAPSERNSGM